MRGFIFAAVVVPLVTSFANSALAEAPILVACKAFAAAVADDYMSDQMIRVEDAEAAPQGYMTAHVAGRKYLVPIGATGENGLKPRAVGIRQVEWGRIYTEERRRCLRQKSLGDFLGD
jgi:hypothetical protein